MLSGPLVWILAAAIAAAAAAWIRYGLREESVPGRFGPAALFATALFLILAGPLVPRLQAPRTVPSPEIAILDISASMDLPSIPGGGSRLDSGLAELTRRAPDRIVVFGTSIAQLSEESALDSLIDVADRSGTRLSPALRAARAAGADSVVVITDGELEDREDSRREAERLGLQLREVRTASPVLRTTLRQVSAPLRVSAGDSITFAVEITTQSGWTAPFSDSVRATIEGPEGSSATVSVERPSPGRSRMMELRLAAPRVHGESSWHRYGVLLDPEADPLRAETRRTVWVEVVPGNTGAVLVSIDPDWEPRQILPVLTRASRGGATAYLRIGPDRWVSAGPTPEVVAATRVRSEAAGSDLLVVQGGLSELPAWLRDVTGRHPRVLVLARGSGSLPGTDLTVGGPVEGDWFPVLPPPSSPVASALAGLDAGQLPPVAALRTVRGSGGRTILQLRRNRRGDELSGALGIASERGRRVLMLAEGTWRWSTRTGSARSVYRGLYAGISGWLLDDFRRIPVTLETDPDTGGGPLTWNVAPGVEDLVIAVVDSAGEVIWTDSVATPGPRVSGPELPAGDLEFEARGISAGDEFIVARPFTVVGPAIELGGRDVGASLTSPARSADARRPAPQRRAPPLWPYVLAVGLLCAEWIWRHRLGLR
jgi:hypothetical protein